MSRVMTKTGKPDVLQLLNRLIEFVNDDDVTTAAKDFIMLVEYGLDPDYVFEVVTSERRFMLVSEGRTGMGDRIL